MKTKTLFAIVLSILAGILAGRSQSQTNVYLSQPFVQTSLSQIKCSGITYNSRGTANWTAPGTNSGNSWYFPTTNILSISFSNSNPLIEYVGSFGDSKCGRGSLVWTDSFYPSDTYRFTIYWSNNIPVPTNGSLLPLTTFGFKTNSP